MDAIVVDTLRKRYGEVQALDGVSFSVREGEVFGLLERGAADDRVRAAGLWRRPVRDRA